MNQKKPLKSSLISASNQNSTLYAKHLISIIKIVALKLLQKNIDKDKEGEYHLTEIFKTLIHTKESYE